jgi:hypothetical protein
MHNLYVVVSAFRVRLEGLADWLYGCAHHRTTFPVTLRTGVSGEERQSTQSETYIVCLECGRHILYDWSTMRAGSKRAASTWRWPGSDGSADNKDVPQVEKAPPYDC